MAEKRITQTRLASAIGMSRSTLVKKLSGQIALTPDDISRIANELDTTMTAIISAAERIMTSANPADRIAS